MEWRRHASIIAEKGDIKRLATLRQSILWLPGAELYDTKPLFPARAFWCQILVSEIGTRNSDGCQHQPINRLLRILHEQPAKLLSQLAHGSLERRGVYRSAIG